MVSASRKSGTRTDRETPRSRLTQRGDRATISEYQPSPISLRERAALYRQRAMEARNPTKADEYRYIAEMLDRDADVFEYITTTNSREHQLKKL